MISAVRVIVAAIIMVLTFAAPVAAGPLEDAIAADNRRDYATALRLYRPLAEQGNATAQNNLGVLYVYGQGVPQSDAEVMRLYRKAADQGRASAQFNFGFMYFKGSQAALKDDAEAMKWFRKAADQGYANAQFFIGVMYADGEGVPQSDAEAVKWYRLAAERGHSGGQNLLGDMYRNGKGVPPDPVRAHMWFSLSAAQGNQLAVKNRDMVAGGMTPAQIAEAQKLASEWKPTK